MRHSDRNRINATVGQHQRKIPGKTNTTPDPSAKGLSTSKRKSGSPAPSGTTSKSRERNSPVDSRAQPTLTQIDFVSKSQDPELDDDDLDYIGGNAAQGDAAGVTQPGDVEFDPDYRPPSSRDPRRNRGTRLERNMKTAMPNRKSDRPKASATVASRKKKTSDQEWRTRNKTLTQMDFVQRWVKLDSDDDSALDYMYYTPKDSRKSNERHLEDAHDDAKSSVSKRRKLNEDCDSKDINGFENVPVEQMPSRDPVTPKRSRRLEIPSSQSPESPGFAIISSSQFRSATRSPLKQLSTNVSRAAQEESPGSGQRKKAFQNSGHASDAGSATSTTSRSLPNSQMIPQPAMNDITVPEDDRAPSISRTNLPAPKTEAGLYSSSDSGKRDRTVVYETDAETDSGDLQDDMSCTLTSPTKRTLAEDRDQAGGSNQEDLRNNDSQDLPPIPQEPDPESESQNSEPPMSSAASICYQRIEKPTQFPLEPIPKLNTQKMAELFPQDSSARPEVTATAETQSTHSGHSHPPGKHQSQMQAQDTDNMLTEIVPESSPVARRDQEGNSNSTIPDERSRKSVIQVESSQPADRFNKPNAEGTYPQGIISRKELLSSSVMESIPVPHFLMGSSQDSVGELYGIPEG